MFTFRDGCRCQNIKAKVAGKHPVILSDCSGGAWKNSGKSYTTVSQKALKGVILACFSTF